jgi:hypothetical protein
MPTANVWIFMADHMDSKFPMKAVTPGLGLGSGPAGLFNYMGG